MSCLVAPEKLTHRWVCGLCCRRFTSARELRFHVPRAHRDLHRIFHIARPRLQAQCFKCGENSAFYLILFSYMTPWVICSIKGVPWFSGAVLGLITSSLADTMVHLAWCHLEEVQSIWPPGSRGNFLLFNWVQNFNMTGESSISAYLPTDSCGAKYTSWTLFFLLAEFLSF